MAAVCFLAFAPFACWPLGPCSRNYRRHLVYCLAVFLACAAQCIPVVAAEMVLFSGLCACSFRSCLLAEVGAQASFPVLLVEMDPSAADASAGDSGTKKKSSFQITSVRKGDTASLSSEVGAIDEFDVDPDEGEGDGDEEDDNLSGSVSLDQSGGDIYNSENPDLVGPATQDVPQSQSKYRVVRIKKKASSVDRKFNRGRWTCWDFLDGNGDPALLPADDQDDEVTAKNGGPRKSSENGEDTEGATTPEEGKRNATPSAAEAPVASTQRSTTSVKRVAFGPVATTTIAATTAAGEDFSTSQSNRCVSSLFGIVADLTPCLVYQKVEMDYLKQCDCVQGSINGLPWPSAGSDYVYVTV